MVVKKDLVCFGGGERSRGEINRINSYRTGVLREDDVSFARLRAIGAERMIQYDAM